MKSTNWVSCVIAAAFAVLSMGQVVSGQVVITNFGANASNDGIGWTYTSGTSTISGTEVFGSYLYGTPINSNISGATQLSITANVTTDPLSNFTVTLEDSGGKTALATFDWTSFLGGATVAVAFTSVDPLFNYNITNWSLDSGSSGNAIGVSFTSLSAVTIPEPSTYALLALGAGAIGIMVRRRRKV